MGNGKWIWYPGDYEIYHALLVNSRRRERGVSIPCQWSLSTPYPNVKFSKDIDAARDCEITVYSTAPGCVTVMTGAFPRGMRAQYATGTPVKITAGRHNISVQITSIGGLPAAYIDSDDVWTDETWGATHATREEPLPAGCLPEYSQPDVTPEKFPFKYERLDPVRVERLSGGRLFDFGRETFAKLHIENAGGEALFVQFGESRIEALDKNCVISEKVWGKDVYEFDACAFRYVYVNSERVTAYCEYEYLPLKNLSEFSCDDNKVAEVHAACVRTFHLNCREFFLDGIKRDRWVWGGDAYQSALVNRYIFGDEAITRRTISALLGRPPYTQHVNCINDYSAYVIIMALDYYTATADVGFIRDIFPRVKALYGFIHSRLEGGLVVGREDDWVFIDWARFDREGPLCAEQILLWRAMRAMAELSALLGEADVYSEEADALKALIDERYWDAEQGAYIDSYVSGLKNVTRHANIFSILYDFSPEKSGIILENVLKNPDVPQITTPYFKLFELIALCSLGEVGLSQKMIDEYWHPMLRLGGTTIWEQFDPNETGAQHYAMYGDPYGRSLCHAWGSGPVYLMGRYFAGVREVSAGYEKFEVAPNPGAYERFSASVPIPGGIVRVEYENGAVRCVSSREGGVLRFAGVEKALPASAEVVISR